MSFPSLINACLSLVGVRVARIVENTDMDFGNAYSLERNSTDGTSLETRKILNLIAYTKARKNTYSAEPFPGGYLDVTIDNQKLQGQRDPAKRLDGVQFNFDHARVLDIGCNHGGMLRVIADRIEWGVGIDYDRKLVNAANRIRAHNEINNLSYYVFDLERENLQLLRNFYPGDRVDIVFLLSIGVWIKNWAAVIDTARSVSGALLFESNGSQELQQAQEEYLRSVYTSVVLIRDISTDDSIYKKRRLLLCRVDGGDGERRQEST